MHIAIIKPQIIATVDSLYTFVAGKQVSENSADLSENSWCICDNLHYGHAQRERVPQVVVDIWCISPEFKPQMIKTVASMYTSVDSKQVTGNSAGQDVNCLCICDK